MMYLFNLYSLHNIYTSYKSSNNFELNRIIQIRKDEHKLDQELKNICKGVLEKYKELKNTHCITVLMNDVAGSEGALFLTNQNKFVIVNPHLIKIDKRAAGFAAKHEIGHILHNDLLRHSAILLISSIAITIIFSVISLTGASGLGISLISLLVIDNIYKSQIMENQADDFAIKNSTLEELQGAICLCTAGKENEDSIKKSLPFFNFIFNFLFATHPSDSKRIAKMQAAHLKFTGDNYNLTLEDKVKIENIKKEILEIYL